MATKASRSAARIMMAPAVVLLLGWMLVPLIMTLYFSFKRYLPLRGDSLERGLDWVGFDNYTRFISSSSFWPSVQTTLVMVGGVLLITVILGILLAMLLDQPIWGQGVVRILVIAPFFVSAHIFSFPVITKSYCRFSWNAQTALNLFSCPLIKTLSPIPYDSSSSKALLSWSSCGNPIMLSLKK